MQEKETLRLSGGPEVVSHLAPFLLSKLSGGPITKEMLPWKQYLTYL